MVFNTQRFIQVITLVGHGGTFANSKDWFVTVGSNTDVTLNTLVGQFTTVNSN